MKKEIWIFAGLVAVIGMNIEARATEREWDFRTEQKKIYMLRNEAELADLNLTSEVIAAPLSEACFDIAQLEASLSTIRNFPPSFPRSEVLNKTLREMRESRPSDMTNSIVCKGFKPEAFASAKESMHQSLVRIKEIAQEILLMIRPSLD